jgi:hypothetical protein
VTKRALLVGIDAYDEFTGLEGCVNDVAALLPLLARNEDGGVNFACAVNDTADEQRVTRNDLLAQVKRLLAPGADVALLYFAGHGAGNGDVTLMTTDATAGTLGVTLAEVLALVATSVVPEINIILDCCFSGGAGAIPQLGTTGAFLRPGLSILTASRADQTSIETYDQRGLFSWYLCAALAGGAADIRGNVGLAGIWAYLTESFGPWEQRPTLKANIERAHVLRTCNPSVSDDTLRHLASWFPEPKAEFALDPSYEDTAGLGNKTNEEVFKQLQKCSYVKLVEPVDEEYMYFAAMNSKACRLTALGQHYHLLAQEDRL